MSQFSSKKGAQIPHVKSGLDFTKPEIVKLMKAVSIILIY